ncbi:serine hydrolase domain-containing protein [Gimibacter soli]|uniref:Serine hydrolase n=1 Tax=Gimibacter soli TaxID=3024400 RepID=A0AAE9XVE5_9PROT|nr:serine hydrolase domain-containing protein [Gimibacter soli]WCL55580.1 serine hydrolase [Gimibacter soli]
MRSLAKLFCHGMAVVAVAVGWQAQADAANGTQITEEAVTAWADETFGAALDKGQITGATISVVKDGALLMAKGYGRANAMVEGVVDPAATRFRIGSITKTFTATLLARLIDQGIIKSVDDPANHYLKRYQLPDNDGHAITIRELMTHSAGFEDTFHFLGSEESQPIPIPAEIFDRMRPAFVRPAGHSVNYSNFGVATLGLLVEDQMGAPINELMERYIFDPLEMKDTDLLVDTKVPAGIGVPGTIAPDGSVTATRFVPINPAAAQTGSIVSTAPDMVKFMLAHLDAGRTSDRIMSPSGFARMAKRYAENSPALTGLGMTFFLDNWNGHTTIAHGGNWVGFHSWMTMIPDEHAGVFISLMSEAPLPTVGQRFLSAFFPERAAKPSTALLSASSLNDAFMRHFLGQKRPLGPAVETDLEQYAGSYQADRRNFTSAEKLGELIYFGQGLLDVTADEKGLYLGGAGPFVPQGQGIFMHETARAAIQIEPDSLTGRMTLTPDIGIYTFSRVPALMHPALHTGIFIVTCLVAALCIVAIVFVRPAEGAERISLALPSLLLVLLPVLAFAGYDAAGSMMNDLYAGELGRTRLVVMCANLAVLAAVWLALGVRHLQQRGVRLIAIVTLANAAVALLILWHYNGLGWSMPGSA